jgi:hypothetical protein
MLSLLDVIIYSCTGWKRACGMSRKDQKEVVGRLCVELPPDQEGQDEGEGEPPAHHGESSEDPRGRDTDGGAGVQQHLVPSVDIINSNINISLSSQYSNKYKFKALTFKSVKFSKSL